MADGTLGDGIQEVFTTPSGKVWVGYFDEGVYGNYGWGAPGPEPMGAHGIVRFASDLTVDWQYPYDAEGGAISHVYAMNVDAETAWSSYYTDFPIVRIAENEVSTWRGGSDGARALLVDDARCALIGGYGAKKHRALLGSLNSGGFVPEAAAALLLPGGAELGNCRFVARGAELHAFVGLDWYKIALADLSR